MMKLSRRVGTLLLATGATSLLGCSQAKSSGSEGQLGQLGLPLTTQGASGVTYRLRDATFVINGSGWWGGTGGFGVGGGGSSTTIVVSSETDPNAATISVPLEEGQYFVELQPGWHFEKITAAGSEPVEATLLSGVSQWVWVSRRSTSFAEYQFGLGGREIWLNGELNLGVVLYEDPSQVYGFGGTGGSFTGTAGTAASPAGGFGTGGIATSGGPGL